MKILAVDTTTMSCSVTVADAGHILAEKALVSRETHSRHLHEIIADVLGTADLDVGDIEGFAVTKGPGSFTGLRIGVSAVKGLAYAVGKPVYAISSLEALAWPLMHTAGVICPMIDARRGEVYTARYIRKDHGLVCVDNARVCTPEAAVAGLTEPTLVVGSGAVAYRRVIEACKDGQLHFASPHLNIIRGASVAELGWRNAGTAGPDNVVAFKPVYIRKSDAELNFRK